MPDEIEGFRKVKAGTKKTSGTVRAKLLELDASHEDGLLRIALDVPLETGRQLAVFLYEEASITFTMPPEAESGDELPSRADLDEELQQIDDCVVALGGPREQALTFLRALADKQRARPLDDYHEDFGAVLWWRFPVDEPPYVGSPNDSEWPGYHTHWTPCPPAPEQPA